MNPRPISEHSFAAHAAVGDQELARRLPGEGRMEAAEDGPRRLTTAMRVVLVVSLVLAGPLTSLTAQAGRSWLGSYRPGQPGGAA